MPRRRPRRPGAVSELPPLRIVRQLALLIGVWYASLLVTTVFGGLAAGRPWTPDWLWGWSALRGDTAHGWMLALLLVLNGGLFLSTGLVLTVVRSKLVPDFALSVHGAHLLVVYLYTHSLPAHTLWWTSMAASAGLSTAVGMWGCRYRELQPITFGGLLDGVAGRRQAASARPDLETGVDRHSPPSANAVELKPLHRPT